MNLVQKGAYMPKNSNQITATKSNHLVDASFFKKMNSLEMRIFNLAVSRLNPKRPIAQERRFEFTVKEFMDYNSGLSVKNNDIYKNIKSAVRNLSTIWVEIDPLPGYSKTEISLITSRSYEDGEGRFMIEFHEDAMPYLAEIKNNYTSILLETFGTLKSEYSLKFYEIFSRWAFKGKIQIKLDDLRELLNVEDMYQRYNNFNLRVLTPALKEINAKTNLTVSVKTIRTGRIITELEFSIFDKSQALATDVKRPPFPHKNKYGRYVHLDKQNPRNSSAEYGNYGRDCLTVLDDYYNKLEDVMLKDLRHYWIFLSVNASHKSHLGTKQDMLDELANRGYKLVNCELVKLEN